VHTRSTKFLLLAFGAVPWLYLVLIQLLTIVVVLAMAGQEGGLGVCFDMGVLGTLALLWYAVAPVPVGVAAIVASARRAPAPLASTLGLGLLGIGFPLLVLSSGRDVCPGDALPFSDSKGNMVTLSGWDLIAYLLVLVCFGAVLVLARRRAVAR
jgi:hypothetical protein